MDHDQAQPVQQCHNGQQQRVGDGREAAHRQVGPDEESEISQPGIRHERRERLVLVQLHESERRDDDQHRENHQQQLGAAGAGA